MILAVADSLQLNGRKQRIKIRLDFNRAVGVKYYLCHHLKSVEELYHIYRGRNWLNKHSKSLLKKKI